MLGRTALNRASRGAGRRRGTLNGDRDHSHGPRQATTSTTAAAVPGKCDRRRERGGRGSGPVAVPHEVQRGSLHAAVRRVRRPGMPLDRSSGGTRDDAAPAGSRCTTARCPPLAGASCQTTPSASMRRNMGRATRTPGREPSYGRHHHDVTESAHTRVLPAFGASTNPLGGGREEITSVHVVGQETRRTAGHPGRVGDFRDLRQDLRGRVAAPDDDHAATRQVLGTVVVHGVQLLAPELPPAGHDRPERLAPGAGRRYRCPRRERRTRRCPDEQLSLGGVVGARHRGHSMRSQHGKLVALLVTGQVVHHVLPRRISPRVGRPRRHHPARQRRVRGRGEEP